MEKRIARIDGEASEDEKAALTQALAVEADAKPPSLTKSLSGSKETTYSSPAGSQRSSGSGSSYGSRSSTGSKKSLNSLIRVKEDSAP
jgi:hypothetical protein